MLPPAPALDTLVPPEELAAELRLAADSAADEAVLEALDDARPADDDAEEPLPATPVSWDIDVDTYHDHDRVQYYLDFFQGKGRERMGIWLTRMPRYEGMIRARLQEQGLPGDLMYLALIESGFSNSATSRAKAVGMWQFMKGTAKGYGLRVDSWVDERRDPYRATAAAARHLRNLNDRFGSLYLAAAAYNAGAGKVSRGVRRLPDDDRRLAQLRRHLLPPVRHQAAPPRDQGLRAEAHRRGAHREGAVALRILRRSRPVRRRTIRSSCPR